LLRSFRFVFWVGRAFTFSALRFDSCLVILFPCSAFSLVSFRSSWLRLVCWLLFLRCYAFICSTFCDLVVLDFVAFVRSLRFGLRWFAFRPFDLTLPFSLVRSTGFIGLVVPSVHVLRSRLVVPVYVVRCSTPVWSVSR